MYMYFILFMLLLFCRYPTARKLERKIIYHVGPTNSGKTYHALQRFYTAKSGVYCGPLRMLAVEVFNKCNNEAVSSYYINRRDKISYYTALNFNFYKL